MKKQKTITYIRTKIALSLILGLIGGASWVYVIEETPKAIASALEGKKMPSTFISPYHFNQSEHKEEKEPTDCYQAINKYAPKYQVDKELLKRITTAESTNNPLAENKTSTASGCFQFVIGTWRHYGKQLWGKDFYKKNIYNPSDNVELASYVIGKYGIERAHSEWQESAYIWDK